MSGTYQRTLAFADSSSRHYLNAFYLSKYPDGKYLMVAHPEVGMAAELPIGCAKGLEPIITSSWT
ncbi:MAG: hypothetical protein ACLRYB_09350 [Segatella copri]